MQLTDAKWTWALIQWQAYQGTIITPLIAIGILLLWHMIRRARSFKDGYRAILRFHKRSQIRHAGSAIAGSCAVMSLVILAVYLSSAPIVADRAETYYRVHHEHLINPSHTWNEINVATAQIKADDTLVSEQATIFVL